MKTLLITLSVLLCATLAQADEKDSQRARLQTLTDLTGEEGLDDAQSAWDRTYARKDLVFGKEPIPFVRKNVAKLPKGPVLDLAMGEGRNSVFLAKLGFDVTGVDISSVGLAKAQSAAAANKVKIQTINADLNKYEIKANTYSVILNLFYLNRSLFPKIKAGLKKGGVIVIQNNTVAQLKLGKPHTWTKEPLLSPNELKNIFSDFEILEYSETNDGKEAVASMIARKR